VAAVVACDGPGGTLRVRGTGDAVAEVAVPDTQGWAAWRTVDATGMIDLPAGESVLRVDCLVEGTPRPVGNLATLTLDRVDPR
jgi:hypothetical protein